MQRFRKNTKASRGNGEKHLEPTGTRAEPIDPSAATCLTELGERVMEDPRKDYTTPLSEKMTQHDTNRASLCIVAGILTTRKLLS